MKKIQSFILALVMVLSLGFSAVPVGVSADGFTLPEGYTFIDTCYNPETGVYLALAKNFTDGNHAMKVYRSTDRLTWSESYSNSLGKNSASPMTRQNLVWWEKENLFVLSNGATVYTSPDGKAWTERTNIKESNTMLATDGQQLMAFARRGCKLFDKVDDTYAKSLFHTVDAYATAGGLTPADENGNRIYMTENQYYTWSFNGERDMSGANPMYTGVTMLTHADPVYPATYDVVYEHALEKWMVVDGSAQLRVLSMPLSYQEISVANDENDEIGITAIAVGDGIILAGKADGGLYFVSVQDNVTPDTVWTAATADGVAMSDEVRSITSLGGGEFLIVTATKIYFASYTGGSLVYSNIDDYKKLGVPTVVTGTDQFAGTQLLGGAYSPVLDMYIVFGNTADNKGKIYTSQDGRNWTQTCESNVALNASSANAAVWWDKALIEDGNPVGAFVVSGKSGDCWYSKDGAAWSYNETGSLCVNGDIVVVGDYLYSPYNVDGYSKFSSLNGENNVERITFTYSAAANVGYKQIAVSNDGKYVFLSTNYGGARVYDTETKAVVNANDGPAGAADRIVDVKWNDALGYFVGVHSTDQAVLGMGSVNDQRELTIRPITKPNTFTAFDVNASRYILGCADGSVYATDTTQLATATPFVKVDAKAGVAANNTYRVTDAFVGKNNEVLVTTSNGPDESDVLLVAADGSEYVKASDGIPASASSLKTGAELTIKLDYVNNSATAVDFKMVTAIYDSQKQLIQTDISDQTMAAATNELLERSIIVGDGVDETCTMKIMMFDNLENIKPLCDVTPFFQ